MKPWLMITFFVCQFISDVVFNWTLRSCRLIGNLGINGTGMYNGASEPIQRSTQFLE